MQLASSMRKRFRSHRLIEGFTRLRDLMLRSSPSLLVSQRQDTHVEFVFRSCIPMVCWLVFSFPSDSVAQHVQEDKPQGVAEIAELISTPRRNSADQKQVRVFGTISVVGGMLGSEVIDPNDKSFCLEDDSAGIWVRVKQAMDEGLLEDVSVLEKLRSGIKVEIKGSLHPGGFAPVILPHSIKALGVGKLSSPIHPNLQDFFRGAYIMRRVAVGGVVQNVTDDSPDWLVRVETGAGHFLTRVPNSSQFTPEKLMDAEIQVTGVAGAARNWRSQFICPRVMIAEADDVKIVRVPAANPFHAERVRIDEIDGFSPGGRSLHRRYVEGAVTYYDGDRTVYVSDKNVGLRLELNRPATEEIKLGDWIEASGFIDSTRYLRGLRGAVVRTTGKRREIAPTKTSVREIIDDHFTVPTWKQVLTKTFDGRVVSLQGEVLRFESASERSKSRIDVLSDEMTFTATLHEPMKGILPGTIVELTGIAKIEYGAEADSNLFRAEPRRVDLLLRSTEDIGVVRKPSWWTVSRIARVLALSLLVAGLAVIWGVALNRRVAKQTQLLANEMRSRRDAAIEFQAAIRERTQLAANIHDTVLQTLAGIGCQLDACSQSAHEHSATTYLRTASRMVQGGQEDLRNIVSALHCLPLDDQTFGESVRRVVERLQRTGLQTQDRANITVNCAENLPRLADFIAGNLLLIIQEATRNAVKHAEANSITITVEPTDGGQAVSISIVDDGQGFNPKLRPGVSDGHFGLETMRGRAERIGGSLTVESQLGDGTRIVALAPLRSFDEAIT